MVSIIVMGKINVKQKGNRGENELCEIMSRRFSPMRFMRSMSSGGIIGGGNMIRRQGISKGAIEMLAGDIVVPDGFRFCLEHKYYGSDTHTITNLLFCKSDLVEWWNQCVESADKCDRLPMLVVKVNYKDRYVVCRFDDIKDRLGGKYIIYNNVEMLVIVALETVLGFSDEFWFNVPTLF